MQNSKSRVSGVIPRSSLWAIAATALTLIVFDSPAQAPVSVARDGYTAEESYRYRSLFESDRVFNATEGFRNFDENVYYNSNWEDVHAVSIVRRGGPIWELPTDLDDSIGNIQVQLPPGPMSLDAFVSHEIARTQGVLAVHEGRIVYEAYPGMDENHNHIWYSTGKTLPATLLTIMEAQGRLDVGDPVETYLPGAVGTAWEGIRVIDVMDMASGLDIYESLPTMMNEDHKVNKYFRIMIGGDDIQRDGAPEGVFWTTDELVYAMDGNDDVAPGTLFQYSSLNTRMLVMLAEAISGQRFNHLLSDYVWTLIGAEGDAFLGVTPAGGAIAGGMMNSRLRDLARYGLLFTPSWRAEYGTMASDVWGTDVSFDEAIFGRCRPALMQASFEVEDDQGLFSGGEPDPEIRCNSRQWDMVWTDGDMYKGGVGGQGLYVSPGRDLVVAWFSTTDFPGLFLYARAIAKHLSP